jgi:DNA-binding CsgD family transcriptional regulator
VREGRGGGAASGPTRPRWTGPAGRARNGGFTRVAVRVRGYTRRVLHGRDAERAAIAALIDEAWASRGGALVLRGDPGVGKSALLADAVSRAEGMRVLRTQGIESESPLAFAALHRLLRPVTAEIQALPAPQARALRAAFGELEADSDDRFLVFLGALSLLAEAAEQAPVLAVIDDAQWLDDASAAAVLFVARRLHMERVALLFAARDGDLRGFDSGDLPTLMVDGLDRDAVAALLTERAGVAVSAGVCDRLVQRTGGNPLALMELPDVLSEEQLAGRAPLPDRLPLTRGVERVFLERYHRLPGPAQTVLLVAAADDSERAATVRAAAAVLGAGEDGIDEAERSGLLQVRAGRIELRHPLVRSAIYNAATSGARRRVHAALAEVMVGSGDVDRRAWHLADAVAEPDATVVAELERVAERALRRGGLEAASAAWERAADLSTEPGSRTERRYAAARNAWLAGQARRARTLAEAALAEAALPEAAQPGLRADIARLRARIEWNIGSATLAHRMILEAAAEIARTDNDRAREMAMFGVAVASFGNDSGVPIDPLRLVAEPAPTDPPRARCFAALLLGLRRVAQRDWAGAVPVLREAFATAESLGAGDQDLLPNLGIAALHVSDDERAQHYHNLLLSRAMQTGAVLMVRYSLIRLVFSQLATGQWAAAEAGINRAIELAGSTGEPALAAQPMAFRALLAAYRNDDGYESRLAEIQQIIGSGPLGILADLIRDVVRWAEAVHAAGHAPSAFHHLDQMTHPITRGMAAVDRLEVAVRADRHDAAAGDVAELERFATATAAPWAAAAAAHGRALLADGEHAERHFTEALRHHAASPRRIDRARTELAYGEYLRRARRRVDARTHLRTALQIFSDIGARAWADRAAQELRASGETLRRRQQPSTADQLTQQELQVARLVAQGLSNRDVAAQLFVSPRTVEFHLRHIFAKLGVTSRTELARLSLG